MSWLSQACFVWLVITDSSLITQPLSCAEVRSLTVIETCIRPIIIVAVKGAASVFGYYSSDDIKTLLKPLINLLNGKLVGFCIGQRTRRYRRHVSVINLGY